MSKSIKLNTTDLANVREIVSQKDARLRVIRAGVAGDSSVKKTLAKLTDRKGNEFSAVRTVKKIITSNEVIEVQSSVSIRKQKDLPATSLQDALARSKSYKATVKDVNGKKTFVFLSWIRKDRETGEVLENPVAMIAIDGGERAPFQPKHAIQFGLDK